MAGKLESLGDMQAKSSRRLSVAKRSRTACRTDSTKPRGQLNIDLFEGGMCADHEQSAIQQKGSVQSTSRNSCLNPSMIP